MGRQRKCRCGRQWAKGHHDDGDDDENKDTLDHLCDRDTVMVNQQRGWMFVRTVG